MYRYTHTHTQIGLRIGVTHVFLCTYALGHDFLETDILKCLAIVQSFRPYMIMLSKDLPGIIARLFLQSFGSPDAEVIKDEAVS